MKKLDTFKGKISAKSSDSHIRKTLNDLQQYLENYEEHDAAEIVKRFRDKSQNPKSHKDQLADKQHTKAYIERTQVLENIYKTIKKIQEDMVDEQDTSIKKRPGFFSRSAAKVKNVTKAGANKIKDFNPIDTISNLFSGLMNWKNLLPSLLSGLVSMLSGTVTGISGFLIGMLTSCLRWMARGTFKAGGFLVRAVFKGTKIIGKFALKGAKFFGGVLKRASSIVVRLVSRGLSKIGGLLSDLWRSIKEKVSPTSKRPGPGNSSSKVRIGKSSAGKAIKGARKPGTKINSKSNSKSWPGKAKEAIESIKTKVIPSLKKRGLTKIAGVLGKAVVKLSTRAVPFLGWGLLAYDAYSAAKRSNSLMQFGVNLLDEATGGLISAAIGTENAGEYIESLTFSEQTANSIDTNGTNITSSSPNSPSEQSSTLGNSTVGQDSIDLASSKMARVDGKIENIQNTNVTNNTQSNLSEFYNKFKQYKNFSYYYSKVLQGEMTVDQATRALEQNIEPMTSKSIEINSIDAENIKQAQQQAVAEAVRISAAMDNQVIGFATSATKAVASTTINNSMINIGDFNPNRRVRLDGNKGASVVQG